MKRFALCPNPENPAALAGLADVIGVLKNKAELFTEDSFCDRLTKILDKQTLSALTFVKARELTEKAEAAIVLGGDGTILRAARFFAPCRIPLIGINLGRIGYMAELELSEVGMLSRLLSDDYRIDRRMMLAVETSKGCSFALNDAVLGCGSLFDIAGIELSCNGKEVNRYRANGLIAATPTGSTAYSLSAGGAVVDPAIEAIIMTPICSHSLSAIPVVFSADAVLTVKNVCRDHAELMLGIDGNERLPVPAGESVTIRKSELTADFLRLKDGGFYHILRRKMADTI